MSRQATSSYAGVLRLGTGNDRTAERFLRGQRLKRASMEDCHQPEAGVLPI